MNHREISSANRASLTERTDVVPTVHPPAVVTANQSATEAGALPCIYRAFVTEVEAIGVSSEREADSPVCWKQ